MKIEADTRAHLTPEICISQTDTNTIELQVQFAPFFAEVLGEAVAKGLQIGSPDVENILTWKEGLNN